MENMTISLAHPPPVPQEVISVLLLCYDYWALSHSMIKQKDFSFMFANF